MKPWARSILMLIVALAAPIASASENLGTFQYSSQAEAAVSQWMAAHPKMWGWPDECTVSTRVRHDPASLVYIGEHKFAASGTSSCNYNSWEAAYGAYAYYTEFADAPNECSNAISLSNLAFSTQGNSSTVCSGGCSYKVDPNATSLVLGGYAGGSNWIPTGGQCTDPTPQQQYDPNKDSCVATGGNYMECVKSDGSHCVTANSKTLCWNNAETGKKITKDGKLAADREVAPGIPTAPTNQTDSTLIKESQTTINNNTYNTNTYGGSGNSGGQGNTGTGNDNGEGGDGGGSDDGGDDNGNDGSVTGGQSCDSPPVCTGSDVVGCGVIYQTWANRCSGGEGLTGDGTSELDGALADNEGGGDPDFTPYGGGQTGAWDESFKLNWQETETGDAIKDKLDSSGFLSTRTCPVGNDIRIGTGMLSISFTPICDLLVKFSNLVMALGYMIGLRIFLGSRKS